MPQPLHIESVNHISFVTRDLEKSAAFYREVLGFRPIWRPPFSFPGAWLYAHGIQLHLIGEAGPARNKGEILTRTNHVAFHVTDIGVAEALLREQGIAYRTNLVPDIGVLQIFFQDPDGNHIELGMYPPAREPSVEETGGNRP